MSKRDNIKKRNKKIAKMLIIALIITIVIEVILTKVTKTYSNVEFARIVTIFGLVNFVFLHFTIGFKNLYDNIVKNRYKISIIMIIVSTLVGMLQNPYGIKDAIFSSTSMLSLGWNIRFFALILASYELFSVITNKNQGLSIVSTIVVTFSAGTQWLFPYIDAIIIGQAIIVLINKLCLETKSKNKLILSAAIIAFSIAYSFTFDSYAISFGYVFLALIISILIKNGDIIKSNKNTRLIVVSMIISVFQFLIIKNFIIPFKNEGLMNTNTGISGIFYYLYSFLLPFNEIDGRELMGTFLSMAPIPMLLSLYYLYKYEKHTEFLLPLTIVTVLETIFYISGYPDIISKITMFSKVNPAITLNAINLANVYLIFYMLEHFDKKIFGFKHTIRITVIVAIVSVLFLKLNELFVGNKYIYLFTAELCILVFTFLNIDDKNYKKTFLFFITLFTLIGGVTVNPIIREKTELDDLGQIINEDNQIKENMEQK